MNYEQMRDYFRRMKAQQPDMHFNEQPEGSLRESLNAKMRAWANCGVPEVYDAHGVFGVADVHLDYDAQVAPPSSSPSYRIVAEPCPQGVRFKRYEQVAGMAELVLVSVEVVRT